MNDEVKFSVFSDLGFPTTSVDIDTFIRLFVNHRPVYGIGKNNIEDAFKALSGDTGNEMQLTKGKYQFYHLILFYLKRKSKTILEMKVNQLLMKI